MNDFMEFKTNSGSTFVLNRSAVSRVRKEQDGRATIETANDMHYTLTEYNVVCGWLMGEPGIGVDAAAALINNSIRGLDYSIKELIRGRS